MPKNVYFFGFCIFSIFLLKNTKQGPLLISHNHQLNKIFIFVLNYYWCSTRNTNIYSWLCTYSPIKFANMAYPALISKRVMHAKISSIGKECFKRSSNHKTVERYLWNLQRLIPPPPPPSVVNIFFLWITCIRTKPLIFSWSTALTIDTCFYVWNYFQIIMDIDEKSPIISKALQLYCVRWNYDKPPAVSDKNWRRTQITRFLRDYPHLITKPSKSLL